MADEQKTNSGEAWEDVGRQFQMLGETISQALKTAWEDEENRRRVNEMRVGLESMANNIRESIDQTAHSPEGQHVISEVNRAARNFKDASEQTIQEVRPRLVSALQQLNSELQKMIDRMENK